MQIISPSFSPPEESVVGRVQAWGPRRGGAGDDVDAVDLGQGGSRQGEESEEGRRQQHQRSRLQLSSSSRRK